MPRHLQQMRLKNACATCWHTPLPLRLKPDAPTRG